MEKWQKRILQKAKWVRDAEYAHWAEQDHYLRQLNDIRREVGKQPIALERIGSTIHAFEDGCLLIRHTVPAASLPAIIVYHKSTVDKWREVAFCVIGDRVLNVAGKIDPAKEAEGIVDAGYFAEFCGSDVMGVDFHIDGVHIPYLFFRLIRYTDQPSQIEDAIWEYRMVVQSSLSEERALEDKASRGSNFLNDLQT